MTYKSTTEKISDEDWIDDFKLLRKAQKHLDDEMLRKLEKKKELEECQTPKKIIYNDACAAYQCPTCLSIYDDVEHPEDKYRFCPSCGQALDWTNVYLGVTE